MKHFIGMAGLKGGYMPNYCDVFPSAKSAAESLVLIHDLTKNAARTLARTRYLDLDDLAMSPFYSRAIKSETGHAPFRSAMGTVSPNLGNEYCEIQKCDCAQPWVHAEDVDLDVSQAIRFLEQMADEAGGNTTGTDWLIFEMVEAAAERLALYVIHGE